jgi:PEGA domain
VAAFGRSKSSDVVYAASVVRGQIGLFVLLSLGGAQTAAADDARAVAGAHYARGLDLAKGGAYEGALQEFNAAYTISPQFAVLYNIGQAQVGLDHPTKAIEALRKYLSEGKERVPETRRQKVQAQMASLSARLAALSITTDRAGASISVDGREVGATPLAEPVRVDAGTHTIAVKLDGIPVLFRIAILRAAERQTLQLDVPVPSSKEASAAAREAVAKAMAAAAAASSAAAEAQVASRAAAAALERERALAAARIYSYQAARAAAAQAEREAAEVSARSKATPGGR